MRIWLSKHGEKVQKQNEIQILRRFWVGNEIIQMKANEIKLVEKLNLEQTNCKDSGGYVLAIINSNKLL